jgi:putative oxidoreductase
MGLALFLRQRNVTKIYQICTRPVRFEHQIGRYLVALLFFAGALQKAIDPSAAQALLAGFGLPKLLIWPAFAYNLIAALLLVANRHVILVTRSLALYCIVTSVFHLIPSDPWQMSIFVKNWAIAGGLLMFSGQSASRPRG